KLCETVGVEISKSVIISLTKMQVEAYCLAMESYRFSDATAFVWNKIRELDNYLNEEKPWAVLKTDTKKAERILVHCLKELQEIDVILEQILQETSAKIGEQFKGPKIKAVEPLFPRLG